MPKMRAKVSLASIHVFANSEQLQFNAIGPGKYPEDGSDEDNTFARFSPAASFTITVANPALRGKFKVGDKLYVDFTEVPEGK